MNFMRRIIFMLIALTTLSCSDDDDGTINVEANSVIFGEVYGQCTGDCRSLFLINDTGIFADSDSDTDFGNWDNTNFEEEALSDAKFQYSKGVIEVPESLQSFEGELGSQTIADFDYFISIDIGEERKSWTFDEINDDLPSDIKSYLENVILVISELREE